MKKILLLIGLCSSLYAQPKLLFYCGITMVKPMRVIADKIEQTHDCRITIIQGGSEDIYSALKTSKRGDLYLPGSDKYIAAHEKEGYFGYRKTVGYNTLAIIVPKGNPLKISSLDDLLRDDVRATLGNPETCSIGKEATKVLRRYKGAAYLEKVEDAIVLYASDSRDMVNLLHKGAVDMGLSWGATAHFPNNQSTITALKIKEAYAPSKRLVLTLLRFSEHKKIAKAMIDLAVSKWGQGVMRMYGFAGK